MEKKISPRKKYKDAGTGKGNWLLAYLLCCVLSANLLCGCGLTETDTKKVKDVEYQILGEKDIPQEFLGIIEEKKQTGFKLTYTDEESLYIAIGYGTQETGGYSISVRDLYLQKGSICLETQSMGPSGDEAVSGTPSCPYLVLRLLYREEPVVFL